MKKIITLFFFLFLCVQVSFAQTQRNPILEYCTGTWCQYCPCGHDVIENTILPNIPNAVIVGYHGPTNTTDPFRNFAGNSILSSLGFSSYPTGIVDRTSAPLSRTSWYSKMNSRLSVPATVGIEISKTYNTTTRELNLTANITALENLTGNYFLNVILLEDSLIAAQTGNSGAGCIGGSNYVHDHVVRAMVNGALGETINNSADWNSGVTLTKNVTYTLPSNFISGKCRLVLFVYKSGASLNTSEIQQTEIFDLEGDATPVELTSFTANPSAGGVQLNWATATETNNRGFEIQKSVDGKNFSTVAFVKGAGTTAEKQSYSFKDLHLGNNNLSYYRLKQVDYNGNYSYSSVLSVMNVPAQYTLGQNYPNPFNPSTVINYSVAAQSHVKITVCNIMGQQVAVLVDENKEAGNYDVNFNASDLSSGVYIYTMEAGGQKLVKKMNLLK